MGKQKITIEPVTRIEGHAKITLDVDGERAWEYKELDADHGYIGIQAEGKAFDFRNIRIQELPRSDKASQK